MLEKAETCYKEKPINLHSYLTLKSVVINTVKENERNKEKTNTLKNVIRIMQATKPTQHWLSEVNSRNDNLEQAYKTIHYEYEKIDAKLAYRGLVGTGESFGRLAFEVGLSWDPILQLPFFSGSCVKGAAKAIAEAVANGDEDINIKITKEDIERIFGYSERERAKMGSVAFHDAYPVKPNERSLILEPDVMTPIYKEQKIEEHLAKPTLIQFLVIAQDVRFRFLLVSKSVEDLHMAKACLKVALEYGIGAKTLVGYSIFEITEDR